MIEQAPKYSGQLVRFARSHQSRSIIGAPCLPEAYPAVLRRPDTATRTARWPGTPAAVPDSPGYAVDFPRFSSSVPSSGNAYMPALVEHGNVRVGFHETRQVEEAVDQLCAAVGLLV